MYRLLVAASAVASTLAVAVPASAQDTGLRSFCADRPGKGTPTCILDEGHWQVELGLFDSARQTSGGVKVESWDAADTFIRYGLTDMTELQFGLTPYNREKTTDHATGLSDTVDGVGDLSIGLRHSLRNPDESGFSAAIAGFVTAPTGSKSVRADGFEGGVILPMSLALSPVWSLGVSPEVDVVADGDGTGRHATYSIAGGIERVVGPWELGVELWASRDDDPAEATTQSSFDLTAIWTPSGMDNAQVDFGLNFGLNDDSPDVEFGMGLARRF